MDSILTPWEPPDVTENGMGQPDHNQLQHNIL
jgi:hypothetical protein